MKLPDLILPLLLSQFLKAQYVMGMVNTTKDMGKGMLTLLNRFDNIKMSCYIQFQFQMAQNKGIKGFAGGDFAPIITLVLF